MKAKPVNIPMIPKGFNADPEIRANIRAELSEIDGRPAYLMAPDAFKAYMDAVGLGGLRPVVAWPGSVAETRKIFRRVQNRFNGGWMFIETRETIPNTAKHLYSLTAHFRGDCVISWPISAQSDAAAMDFARRYLLDEIGLRGSAYFVSAHLNSAKGSEDYRAIRSYSIKDLKGGSK